MKIIESFKEDINNSLKEIEGTADNQLKELNKNDPRPKNGSTNNKENINGGKPGNGKPRKEVKNHKCKIHQLNTMNRKENIRCRRD